MLHDLPHLLTPIFPDDDDALELPHPPNVYHNILSAFKA